MDSKIVVKIKYGEDTRRISVDLPFNIKQLFGILQELFPSLETQYVVKYVDEDSDYITVSSDLELREALSVASKQQNNVLRLFIFDKKDNTPKSKPAEEPKAQPAQHAPAFPFGNFFNDPNVISPLFSQLLSNPQLFNVVPQALNTFASNPALWNTVPELLQSFLNNASGTSNASSANNNNNSSSALPKEIQELLQLFGLSNNSAVNDLVNQALANQFVKDLLPQLAARLSSFQQQQQSPSSNSNAGAPFVHVGVFCDVCNANIVGKRFKCSQCPDYDLCQTCELKKDVHHPQHSFVTIERPVSRCPYMAAHPNATATGDSKSVHHGITCDGCNKHPIVGPRFKCTVCADYDLCESCEAKKSTLHSAEHGFLKIAFPRRWGGCHNWRERQHQHQPQAEEGEQQQQQTHFGVRCDGCNKLPIVGIRYKCTVCPDYDLCEACEAKKAHGTEHTFAKIAQASRPVHRWHGQGGRRWGGQGGWGGHPCGNFNANNNNGSGRCGRWARFAEQAQQQQQQQQQQPAAPRHLGRFVADVTIPDGSIMEPEQKFVKIWRMRNEGSAPWEENTCLIFVGGDSLSTVDTVVVPNVVQPGEDVDLSVDMIAPAKPGRYVGYWRLQLADGSRFGQRVWVDVFVNAPAAAAASTSVPASPVVAHKGVETTPVVATPVTPVAPQLQEPLAPESAPLYPVITPSAPAVEEPIESFVVVDTTPAPSAPAVDLAPVAPASVAVDNASHAPPAPEDPAELKQLLDMGFNDREQNIRLLEKNKYNMLRTIQELLSL